LSYPSGEAESVIQSELKAGLSTPFAGCVVRHEQSSQSGRLDLEIVELNRQNPGSNMLHAVLELKVLRSHHHTGANVPAADNSESVSKGVAQAIMYGRDRNARASALCCFDMRTTDTNESCFDAVSEFAAQEQISLRRWYLYNSSERMRQARVNLNQV
jgi:hypothetical protein